MKTLIDLIHSIAKRPPYELFAYKSQYRTFRYRSDDVFVMIQKTAAMLQSHGVRKGDRVLLWGFNSPAWVIAFLGTIWHGAVAVPVDARQTLEFVQKIQQQVKGKVLFTSIYKPKLKFVKTIFLEELEDLLKEIKQKRDAAVVAERDLAQILYTSGTTGAPKGVMLSHKNIIANINSLLSLMSLEPRYSFLSVLPLSHAFEQTVGLFLPLAAGCRVVYSYTLKSSVLLPLFRKERIMVVIIVPRLLQAFRDYIVQSAEQGKKIECAISLARRFPLLKPFLFRKIHALFGHQFKYFVVGGAPLDRDLEEFWNDLGFTLLQGYGLSETAPVLTCNTPKERKIGSVGKIIPGVQLRFVDGEILVRGDNVFSGYYRDSEKTIAAFDQGWFRTGDLGEIDNEGFVFIKGRKKDLIITAAGVNVYPEDIEAVLNKLPGVLDSCVVGLAGKAGEEVHAVLLLKKGASPKKIISIANKHLDSSQQIKSFSAWPFDDFPRTTTLKVQKFVVLQWLQTKKAPAILKAPPRKTNLHRVLAQLTPVPQKIKPSATLGLDLQLTSIDRVELAALLEQELNIDVDENLLTAELTVKELENLIEQQHKTVYRLPISRWALWLPLRLLRFVLQWFLFFPLVRLFAHTHVKGTQNLRGIKGPVVFAPNHQSYFDAPVVLSAIPSRFSTRTAVATWAEYFDYKKGEWLANLYRWLALRFVTIVFNSFLLPHEKAPRQSLEYIGELLDKGWSILYFPEGTRTPDGNLLPFMQGIGMIATKMKVPIVPVRIRGLFEVFPRFKKIPKFGKVIVHIGKPLLFGATTSAVEATNAIAKAVKKL